MTSLNSKHELENEIPINYGWKVLCTCGKEFKSLEHSSAIEKFKKHGGKL